MNVKKCLVFAGCMLFAVLICAQHDHFFLYEANGTFEGTKVTLMDQFSREIKRAKVMDIDYFGNPVSKNGSKIFDKNAHLAWYKIYEKPESDVPVKRVVVFENQFGKQKCLLGKPVYICVPTYKIEEGLSFPEKLNHFKAYKVLKWKFEGRNVKLKDQFHKEDVEGFVKKPLYFCNPVVKNRGTIKDKEFHLTCYLVDTEGIPLRKVKIKNQFEKGVLEMKGGRVLCVPTKKISWKKLER